MAATTIAFGIIKTIEVGSQLLAMWQAGELTEEEMAARWEQSMGTYTTGSDDWRAARAAIPPA